MVPYRLFILLILLSGPSHAQNWQAMTDEAGIRALFTDTVVTVELKDGVVATSRYNSDGTGDFRCSTGITSNAPMRLRRNTKSEFQSARLFPRRGMKASKSQA